MSLALAVLLLASCDKSATPAPPAPGVPAAPSAPLANAPVSGHIVRPADGLDLAQVANQQMIHPLFRLVPPASEAPLIFAVLQNDAKNAADPVILRKTAAAWKIIDLAEAPQQEWAYVAAGPNPGELWGILDATGDNEIDHLTLLHSTDAGVSWQFFAAVKKVSTAADFSGFSLDKTGQGRLTMHLLEDDDDTPPISHGYYHYTTTDGGKTWRGPTFESDDTADAESLKGATLPEALKPPLP